MQGQAILKAQEEAEKKEDDDPYARMDDWYEKQDRINAEMLGDFKGWMVEQRVRRAANEIESEKKLDYEDPEVVKAREARNLAGWYQAQGTATSATAKDIRDREYQEGLKAYYEGRKAGEDDYLNSRYDFWNFTRISDIPKPVRVLTATEETLVKVLGVTTVFTDILVTRLSLGGAILEVGLGATDGPAPLGELTGIAAYEFYVNPLENILSAVGFGATALSDIIQGNTYIDASNDQKVIGQDTLVSGAGILVGNQPFLPLEGFLDSAVNIPILYYDARGLAGNPVLFDGRTWELRIDSQNHEAYFLGYAE